MKVSVIGLGKLGLPLVAVLSAAHTVWGYDAEPWAVERALHCETDEPKATELLRKNAARVNLTGNLPTALDETDVTFIVVPTPSYTSGRFSIEQPLTVMRRISALDPQRERVVVLMSTVNPGDCEKLNDVLREPQFLVYAPQFVALGNVVEGMQRPAVLLYGVEEVGDHAGWVVQDVLRRVYEPDHHPREHQVTYVEAEIAKLALNAFVTTKISFANTIDELCARMGADADNVLRTVGDDPRVGRAALKPGGPFGGPCFPRDNLALAAILDENEVVSVLPRAVQEVNKQQIRRVLYQIDRSDKVGILGLTYKTETVVTDESLGAQLRQRLLNRGCNVRAYDPRLALSPADNDMQSIIDWADVIVIATPHPEFEHVEHKRIIDPYHLLRG